MFLTYNGIDLEIEHVTAFEQMAVYDPSTTDYLYTHFRISVRSIWNPEATSNGGAVAAVSVGDLRQTLLTPRKELEFKVPNSGADPWTVVLSPLFGPGATQYICDANNGPKPLYVNIAQIDGQKTMVVDYAIETWVVECVGNRPILSHRWEMSSSMDEDFFTTRTINGIAIFRTDWLVTPEGIQRSPDQFRGYLFFPIVNGFQRKQCNVQLSSDNTSLRYTIVDTEQYYSITPAFAAITSIDVNYAESTGQVTLSSIWDSISSPSAFAILTGTVLVDAFFPKTKLQANIRVRGKPKCSLNDMRSAGLAVSRSLRFGNQQLFGVELIPSFLFHTSFTSYSLTKPMLELVMVAEYSASNQTVSRLFGVGPIPPFQASPDNPVYGSWSNGLGGGPTSNPGMSNGSRQYPLTLVAQMFVDPCASPPQVPTSKFADVGVSGFFLT